MPESSNTARDEGQPAPAAAPDAVTNSDSLLPTTNLSNQPPPPVAPVFRLAEETAPDVPGYEIISRLAAGGMGVVYRARQLSLNRTVALKVIRAEAASPELLVRFAIEAAAAARLQHPNIVAVYDFGRQRGRPYVAMELVEGDNLARFLAGKPLPPHQAAALVETLARAIHYAHQNGVVHRDLKPANILLQESGVRSQESGVRAERNPAGLPDSCLLTPDSCPKITDFGLAKCLDSEDGLTQPGVIIGTPSYMPPEQARGAAGEVGPLADVYALGAVLYEALGGRPPFLGATSLDTLQQVLADEPVPLRRLVPQVPRDLETICLKCLEKEPGKRYPSAEALADDLRRFQADEPIHARPASLWDRSLKWGRRRPAAAALLAFACLAVLGALAGAWWHNARLRDERDEAERQKREAVAARRSEGEARQLAQRREKDAAAQRDRARANFQHARDAVDQLLTRMADKHLPQVPQLEVLRRRLLEDALMFYHRFLKDRGTDPEVRYETARAHGRVADIRRLLGDVAEAERGYREAITLFQRLVDEFPKNVDYRHDLTVAQNNLGILLQSGGRLREAEAFYRLAAQGWAGLAKALLHSDEHRQGVGHSHSNLGSVLQATGRFREAEQAFREALALFKQLADASPAVAGYRYDLARVHLNLGQVLAVLGAPDKAEEHARRAVELARKLVKDFPGDPEYRRGLAAAHNNLGMVLQAGARFADAGQAFRDALAVRKGLADDFPAVPDYRHELARSHNTLGLLLAATGRPREAEQAYGAALELLRALVKDFAERPGYRHDLARSLNNLGVLRADTRRPEAAQGAYREAITWLQPLAEKPVPRPEYRDELALSRYNLGNALTALGKFAEAEAEFRLALGVQEKLVEEFPQLPDYHSRLAGSLHGLALALAQQDKLAEGRPLLKRAVRHQETAHRSNPRQPIYRLQLRNHYQNLAETHVQLEEHAEAAEIAARLPPLFPKIWNEYHRAGQFLARCVPLAEKDARLPAEKRQALAGAYGERAVALLREAVRKGMPDPGQLRTDPDLAALRGRDDFQKLVGAPK
jgi:serine/threonine protein kinase/tetratricopeptide (TPR) repeat protein